MRIVLADDELLFRDSLKLLLEAHGHEVVGEGSDGREARARVRECQPDLVLMDLRMPGMDGLTATQTIRRCCPHVKIVVLTGSSRRRSLCDAIEAGANGFLHKTLDAERTIQLLNRLENGEPALDPDAVESLMKNRCRNEVAHLTARELEVLSLMVDGTTSNQALARALGISENTVKFHLANLLDKLQVHNRADLVAHALRTGIVDRL